MFNKNDNGDRLSRDVLRAVKVRIALKAPILRSSLVLACFIGLYLSLTIACGGKVKSKVALANGGGGGRSFRTKTVFTEPFDTLDGWSYSPDSPSEAVFRVSRGLLTVGSYGAGALPSGPRIMHAIPGSLHTDTDAFALETVLFTSEGGTYGRVSVSLLDTERAPAVAMVWEPAGSAYLAVGGVKKRAYRNELGHPFSGKLSVWHVGAKYSLRLNDGPELVSLPATQKKVLRYIKIAVVRTDTAWDPPDFKIDLVRLQRILGVD